MNKLSDKTEMRIDQIVYFKYVQYILSLNKPALKT